MACTAREGSEGKEEPEIYIACKNVKTEEEEVNHCLYLYPKSLTTRVWYM